MILTYQSRNNSIKNKKIVAKKTKFVRNKPKYAKELVSKSIILIFF